MKRNSNAITNRVNIKVLVADDHPVVRHGIIANLKLQQDMLVVAEDSDGIEAIKLIKEHLPDVVLLDLRMPEATLKALADHGQLGSLCQPMEVGVRLSCRGSAKPESISQPWPFNSKTKAPSPLSNRGTN